MPDAKSVELSCRKRNLSNIDFLAFCGSKPSASYFKRDFCTAHLHQKVPKIFEVLRQKKSSRTT